MVKCQDGGKQATDRVSHILKLLLFIVYRASFLLVKSDNAQFNIIK